MVCSTWVRGSVTAWLIASFAAQGLGCFSEDSTPSGDDDDDDDDSTTASGSSASAGTTSTSTDAPTSTSETGEASSSTADSSSTSDDDTTGGADCELAPGLTWDDDFVRADADDIGNCWVEKAPSVWRIEGESITSDGQGATQYFDHLVWREGLVTRNVEIKVEFRVSSDDLLNEPQALVRMTQDSLAPGARYHGYALGPRAQGGMEPLQLCLMRFDGGQESGEERCENLLAPLELFPTRYRLVLVTQGPGPVILDGRLDVLHDGDFDWTPLLTLPTWEDASPEQIDGAGAVGFSGGAGIEQLGNFAFDGVQLHHLP